MSFLTKVGQVVFTHRSAIFMGCGIALGTGCIVTTAVQTVKACDIIEDANSRMDEREAELNNLYTDTDGDRDDATEKMIASVNADIKTIRKSTNLRLVKTYIVPASLAVGSLVCFLAAYKILSSQKAAALAALSSVTTAFDKYRSRVIDKYGVEEDYNLYMGKTEEEIETEYTDPKTGKTKKKKEKITKIDPIDSSCYSRVFSSITSPAEWCFNQKLCIERLQRCEDNANRLLNKRGRYTLNELYMDLGLESKVGYYTTEKALPNNIGWLSREILDAISDRYPGPYDSMIKFAPVISSNFFDDGITHYDGSYRLDFNCYPNIDEMVEYYEEKKRKGLVNRPD